VTKLLNGRELADFIKARQARQVRALIRHSKITPKFAILTTSRPNHEVPVIETYIRMKQNYAADIAITVEIFRSPPSKLMTLIKKLNADTTVHGMIVQLPLQNPTNTTEVVNAVAPAKDVDALGNRATLNPATPMAINWLLAGYNIDLKNKKVVIVGHGRLVGAPLSRMWRQSDVDVEVIDESTTDFGGRLSQADVVVSATGVPNLIRSNDIKMGAVVVDAGTASEHGKIVGDLAADVRQRHDLTITPEKGGVGPLTITALMDNVIRAATTVADRTRS
jgi:methylenetetrahydrofolate dehydrogenase (NADP+)/methenyltetrahydrofolate cyclohydrolase